MAKCRPCRHDNHQTCKGQASMSVQVQVLDPDGVSDPAPDEMRLV